MKKQTSERITEYTYFFLPCKKAGCVAEIQMYTMD